MFQIQGVYFRGAPEVAWRYVFLSGLIPAFVAIAVRLMIKEPERELQKLKFTPERAMMLDSAGHYERLPKESGPFNAQQALLQHYTERRE